jgi:energy-coupling factor transporter ATP-binding protein EcfA2
MKRAEIAKKFDEIVAFAELEEFIDTPIKRYSSGMQVRLGFAVATSVVADILIVDEVLAVGDLAFQRKCFDRMEDLIKRSGKTVLIVSHNLRQVERLCPRVILLEQGRIACDGPATDTCNAFYERSDRKIQNNRALLSKGAGRFVASGEVELLNARLLDNDGHNTKTVVSGADMTFEITYKVNRHLHQPVFGVGIHTTDFIYLATIQSVGHLQHKDLAPGIYDVRCQIDRIPLLPGVYSLRIGVAVGEFLNATLYAENVLSFQVISPDVNRAWASHEKEGFVALHASWNLTQNGDGVPELPASRSHFDT